MLDPNLDLLQIAAARLRPLLRVVVFVGGCATGLLITDPGAAPVRSTNDVDVIAEIASYAEFVAFSERLRALKFQEDTGEGAPVCRWRHNELILDVMPLDEKILGFSNRWYSGALQAAVEVWLGKGLTVRAITAPWFLGTKLEAFRGRGQGDYFASRDLEDVVTLVDGRVEILAEMKAAPPRLRNYVAAALKELLADTRFLDALPGFLLPDPANQARIGELTGRLRGLSEVV